MSGKRVLITGCSGFIGRSLAEACLAEGWAVRGSIRLHNSPDRLPAGVEPIAVADIGPNTDWTKALKSVDAVVHLAARVHRDIRESVPQKIGAAYFHTNTAGTERLVMAAAEAGVRRLVFLSSLKVNGETRAEAYRESDTEAPSGPYAVSKYKAENILRKISSRTGLQSVILRPPLVYGPGVKANFLSLMKIVDKGIPLPLASVVNRRTLIFIDNLVEAVLICLHHPNAAGKTYLISDMEQVSTPELIQKLALFIGVQPRLIRFPIWMLLLAGRLMGKREAVAKITDSFWADTSRIKFEINWSPSYRLTDGLKKTAEWYRSKFHASTL